MKRYSLRATMKSSAGPSSLVPRSVRDRLADQVADPPGDVRSSVRWRSQTSVRSHGAIRFVSPRAPDRVRIYAPFRVRRRHRGRQRSVLAWALECSVVDQRRSGGSVEDNRFGAAWEFGHLARSFHCAGATSPSHVARAGIARECIDSENGMIPIARLHLGSRSFSSRYVDANTTDRTRFLADVRVGAEGRIRTVTRARFTKRLRACNKTLRNLILGPEVA